jgi:hypothetical protein
LEKIGIQENQRSSVYDYESYAKLQNSEGLNRIVHIIGAPGYSMLLIIGIIYSSIIVYDLKTERSVQWSTLISVALFGVLATAIYTVFKTQTWGDWVVSMVTNI